MGFKFFALLSFVLLQQVFGDTTFYCNNSNIKNLEEQQCDTLNITEPEYNSYDVPHMCLYDSVMVGYDKNTDGNYTQIHCAKLTNNYQVDIIVDTNFSDFCDDNVYNVPFGINNNSKLFCASVVKTCNNYILSDNSSFIKSTLKIGGNFTAIFNDIEALDKLKKLFTCDMTSYLSGNVNFLSIVQGSIIFNYVVNSDILNQEQMQNKILDLNYTSVSSILSDTLNFFTQNNISYSTVSSLIIVDDSTNSICDKNDEKCIIGLTIGSFVFVFVVIIVFFIVKCMKNRKIKSFSKSQMIKKEPISLTSV